MASDDIPVLKPGLEYFVIESTALAHGVHRARLRAFSGINWLQTTSADIIIETTDADTARRWMQVNNVFRLAPTGGPDYLPVLKRQGEGCGDGER